MHSVWTLYISCETSSTALPRGEEKRWHVLDALPAEGEVVDREDPVDQQSVGVEMGGHRIAEARLHAGAVGEDRRVDELLELRELDDLIEKAARLVARQAEQRGVVEDVLAT